MPQHRVVITGLGAVTPLGLTVDEYWQGLINGRSAIVPITKFDTSKHPVKVAAEIRGFEPTDYMDIKRVDRTALCTQYAIAATKMALDDARLDMAQEKPERLGVVTATSGAMDLLIDQGEILRNRGPMRLDPLLISKVAPSMVSAIVGLEFCLKGPNSSLNSACASGNDALGTAMNLLRMGHADLIAAGGAETQVDHVHPLVDRPPKSCHQEASFRLQGFVEDADAEEVGVGRLLPDNAGAGCTRTSQGGHCSR